MKDTERHKLKLSSIEATPRINEIDLQTLNSLNANVEIHLKRENLLNQLSVAEINERDVELEEINEMYKLELNKNDQEANKIMITLERERVHRQLLLNNIFEIEMDIDSYGLQNRNWSKIYEENGINHHKETLTHLSTFFNANTDPSHQNCVQTITFDDAIVDTDGVPFSTSNEVMTIIEVFLFIF